MFPLPARFVVRALTFLLCALLAYGAAQVALFLHDLYLLLNWLYILGG